MTSAADDRSPATDATPGTGAPDDQADLRAALRRSEADLQAARREVAALRLSEARHRRLVDSNVIGVITAGFDGTITEANDRFLATVGRARSELAAGALRWDAMTPERWRAGDARIIAELAATGACAPIEKEFVRGDGALVPVRLSVALLEGDSGACICLVEDLTERRQAESALRASEERFREVAENNEAVFWVIDPVARRMLYISPAYERIWGRSCASLHAEPGQWLESIHVDDRARMGAAAANFTSGTYEETYRIVRPDGAERWIRDRAFPVFSAAGLAVRVIGTATDITGQRTLEEQLRQAQKMEAVGQLAGGIAHDFNNLLMIIGGYSSLVLARMAAADPLRGKVEQIQRAGERAAALTRQLLTFSRKQVLQTRVLDLDAVVEESRLLLTRVIGEDIALSVARSPQPALVVADPDQLGQVLLNLAVNARDAMPRGGALTIRAHVADAAAAQAAVRARLQPGRWAVLTVADTGTGMSAHVQAHLFEPFFTTKDPGKGTGLGLSVVHGIVAQSGGHIAVASAPGAGTTFTILLPVAAASAAAPGPAHEPATARHGTETVLLVEDEEPVRRLSALVLRSAGYTVLAAADGGEAQRTVAAHAGRIDVLVTDMVMPGIDGRQLATLLRERLPALKLLFMSGYAEDAVLRSGLESADSAFLQKPFSPVALANKVRQVLDGGR